MKQAQKPKKKINLPADTEGLPVAPLGLKERKADITSEIKLFLQEPITLESIKYILLRLSGPITHYKYIKSKVAIAALKSRISTYDKYDFIVAVEIGDYTYKYYVDSMEFYKLGWFSQKDLGKSSLKKELGWIIFRWLSSNLEKCQIIEAK